MERRKIACFLETWRSGGIESFLHNILLHMDLSALEVHIVAAVLEESVFTAPLQTRGVRFIQLSGSQRSPRNHGLFRELLRREKYDVVHLNLFQGLALYYARIARQEGVPVCIAHSHNSALRKSPTRWLKLCLHDVGRRLFTQDATELWACSQLAADFLFSPSAIREQGYTFIPNGIDTERFRFDSATRQRIRAELGLTDTLVIGNVGRLTYQKNQNFLLDVFAEVIKTRPDSRLLLVGEGEDRPALEEKAAQLNISDRVIFHGVSDRVEELMWAMDVFAFPSKYEGLGIVALEAQAAGLSVFCSEHVPREAGATKLVHFLPLSEGAAGWSAALLHADSHTARESRADAIRAAGFDVRDTAKLIEGIYRG